MACIGLSSCHIYKKFELPEYSKIASDYKKGLSEACDSTSLGNLGWEEVFTDPMLQKLIRQALANNKDLDNARSNVNIAHAQLKGAKLAYLPSLTLQPNGGTASYGGSHVNWSYTIPLAASWEIDIFGKLLNRKWSAGAAQEMAQAYEQAVRSQIIGGVANTYYGLVYLNQQLVLARNTAVIWKEQVESMKLMKEAGRVNEAAVVQSEANYYSVLSSIPDIEKSIHTLQNTMSLLLNTYPQTWEVTSSLNFTIPEIAISGVPMNYLAQRPDVRATEKSLAQAYYATNIARTNFYPSLVISAQGGFTNLIGSVITNPGKWFIQLAGSLTAPLFARGQNIAQLEVAKEQQKQALNNFEYSVLNAAAEVSDAMVTIEKNSEKREQLMNQIVSLEKSVEYTQELLTLGQATYLEVLTAESGLLSAQMTSLQCWHDKVSAMISLYQALGGGR